VQYIVNPTFGQIKNSISPQIPIFSVDFFFVQYQDSTLGQNLTYPYFHVPRYALFPTHPSATRAAPPAANLFCPFIPLLLYLSLP